MTNKRKALGAFGEDIAANFLIAQGMSIEQRNWRCEIGEVDIVAIDRDELVICEVKTRTSTKFGHPVEAVTPRKLATLRKLAGQWLRVKRSELAETGGDEPGGESGAGELDTGYGFNKVRIDVIGVLVEPGVRPQLTHLKAVG